MEGLVVAGAITDYHARPRDGQSLNKPLLGCLRTVEIDANISLAKELQAFGRELSFLYRRCMPAWTRTDEDCHRSMLPLSEFHGLSIVREPSGPIRGDEGGGEDQSKCNNRGVHPKSSNNQHL